jgi:hypothetical protein
MPKDLIKFGDTLWYRPSSFFFASHCFSIPSLPGRVKPRLAWYLCLPVCLCIIGLKEKAGDKRIRSECIREVIHSPEIRPPDFNEPSLIGHDLRFPLLFDDLHGFSFPRGYQLKNIDARWQINITH